MKNSWAVRDATDEVLELSAQLGVKNEYSRQLSELCPIQTLLVCC